MQIIMTLLLAAPVGCLQYYTGASGEFKSFNYKSEVSATNDPNHLANQGSSSKMPGAKAPWFLPMVFFQKRESTERLIMAEFR